ncbi:transglutaminase domain-containing protein [Streptococcus merionis]|uniref:transglutaminase domain-containing protein n=1 Tax=Streptococcus merionis TaxID=400065 RepID=UPI0035192C1F
MNRKRMTTCQLALLTATAIGLSTLALNPAFAEQKNATVTASQSQKTSMHIEKSSLSNQEFVEKLKTEITDSDEVRIWMLGHPTFWKQNVKLSDLANTVPKDYRFVVINHKNSHDGLVFIVKDNDLLVNSEEEYTTAAQKKFQTMESQDVHGLFDLQRNNYDVILRSNGLSALKSSHIGINGLPLYSKTIGVTSPFKTEYGNHELTLEKIKENDEKLKQLIRDSGADKATTDADKVKLWTTYVTSNIPYDELSFAGKGEAYGYELSSDLFSVATRRKAMCVGFSIAAARAMNLLGMPAYVVSGALDGGGAHAATRVYFDGKWHTLEATTSWGEMSGKIGKAKVARSYQNWRLDSYTLITKDNQDKTPTDGTGYMIIDPDFEEWAKGQETSKLLYINTEAAFVNRTPFVISKDLQKKMQKMNEQLKTSLEALKAKDTENTYKNAIESLIKTVEENISALKSQSKIFDTWTYEQYMTSANSVLTFYNQIVNGLNKSGKSENSSENTDFTKLKEEVEKQVKEEKEAHDKKLEEKTAKVYEEKKEEAPAKATFTPAEPAKSQESMITKNTDAEQLTAKKKTTISEITALKLPTNLANQYKTRVNDATSITDIDSILNEAKAEAEKYSALETEREKQKQIIWTTPNLLPGERDDYDKLLANASSTDEMQRVIEQAKEKSAANKVIFDKQAQLQSQVSNSQYLSSDEKAKLNSWIESSKTEKELEQVTKDINSAEATAKAQAEKAKKEQEVARQKELAEQEAEKAKERQEQERAELEAKQKQAEEAAQKAEAERQRLEEEKAAEAARLQAEAQAKLEREEAEKRRQAELEAEQKQAEETAQKAELERQRLAEEAAALEAQKQATEAERLQEETQLESEKTESLRQAELEAEQKLAEKKAQEEQAAQEAKELQRQAEEIAQKAEAERQRLEAEQAALIAQQQAAEAARLQAEAQAQLEREEAAKRQAELEAEQKQAEEAVQKAELERQRLAKEAAALAITPTETEVLSVEKAQAEQNHQNETTTSSTVEKELPIRRESTNSITSRSTPKNENAAEQKQEVPSSMKTEEQAEPILQAEPRTTLLQTQVGDTRIEAEFSKEMTEVNQLHAQKVEDHTLIQSVAQRVGVNAENVTIYDLTLANDAHKVHSSELRTVRIAVSDTRKDYKVYHIKEDGTLELLPSSMENGKVVFNVNHFSKFAIVAVDKNEMANKKQLPQTGTANWSGAFLGFGLMVLSLLGFKKRNEN